MRSLVMAALAGATFALGPAPALAEGGDGGGFDGGAGGDLNEDGQDATGSDDGGGGGGSGDTQGGQGTGGGGDGGDGGTHGYDESASGFPTTTITGSDGANGDTGANSPTGSPGGGGGAGGYGSLIDASSGSVTVGNGQIVTGGDGGGGGDGGIGSLFGTGAGGDGGDGGIGLRLDGGNLIMESGGEISGGIGGNGLDRDAIGGDGGSGVALRTGDVQNSGTIEGGAGGNGDDLGGEGGFGVGLSDGELTNQGMITGGDGGNANSGGSGVRMVNGDLTNSGTISAGDGGAGNISGGGGGGDGIFLGGGDLKNSGTISAGDGGDADARGGAGGFSVSLSGGDLMNSGTITGGSGGDASGPNGMAGFAGFGVSFGVLGVPVSNGILTNSGAISGGDAGDATGTNGEGIFGGHGVRVFGGGVVKNSGTITGGDGGSGDARDGVGGIGVIGANLTVINSDTISGGISGDGITRGNAVRFTGGANRLELRAGFETIGDVVANGDDTFALGGNANSSFNVSTIGSAAQYQGFESFEKTGDSIWTLTGTTAAQTPWTINQGTLSISSDANLGAPSGVPTIDGGILQNTAAFTTSRNITLGIGGGTFETQADLTVDGVISGPGTLTKTGIGTLTLTGTNTYTGGTTINTSRLSVSSDANLGAATGKIIFNGGTLRNTAAFTTGRDIVLNSFDGTFETQADLIITGDISGEGTKINDAIAIKEGPGTLTLTGTGGVDWKVDDGTLIGDTEAFGGDLIVFREASVVFQQTTDGAYAGSIIGRGPIVKRGPGQLTLLRDREQFAGNLAIAEGTVIINNVFGGSGIAFLDELVTDSRGVSLNLSATVDILPHGTLGGNGEIAALVNNEGVIAPGNSIGTLRINGLYNSDGGELEIEAKLSGDGFPADQLLISSDVTGTTLVHVENQGGTGAPTGHGNTGGASIVQVGGLSTRDAFQLAGGYVAVGPYRYELKAFGPAVSADSEREVFYHGRGEDPGYWDYRLQSTVMPSDSPDAPVVPVLVPQIPAYRALGPGALQYGWALFDNLHQRLGEIHHLAENRDSSAADSGLESFFRVRGRNGEFNGGDGPDFEQDMWFLQTGANLVGWGLRETGDSLRLGMAFSYGRSQIGVQQPYAGNSSAKFRAPSLALTGTYQGASGWYLDSVVRGTHYDTEVATAARGQTADFNGAGFGTSLETGRPFVIGQRLILEPQAQLAYQRNWFDEFTDVDGVSADLHDNSGLRGRVGGRLQKTFVAGPETTPRLWSPYLSANVVQGFLGAGNLAAGGVDFGTDTSSTALLFGTGLNAQLGERWGLYSNATYIEGLADGGIAYAWAGMGGVRLNF